MKLDAWMEQDHSLDESLRLIESLCQAVNAVHDRGDALGALQPDRIEVDPGGQCDISAASGGSPSPEYAAPDGDGDAAADVFAAGRIAWEILTGRPGGDSPQHLAEVRPDIPKELADAIMACLERSADWRPKDLTFLAQMAAARQKGTDRPAQKRRATRTPRRSPARTRSRRSGRRTWPLLVALVVVLGLAAFAWKQFAGSDGFPWNRTATSSPAPVAAPVAPPVTEPAPAEPAAPPIAAPTTPPATEPATSGEAEVAPTAPPDAASQTPPPREPEPASPPETAPVESSTPVAAPAPAVAAPPVRVAAPEPPPTSRPAPSSAPAVPPAPAPAPVAPPRTAPDTSNAQPASPSSDAQAAPAAPAEPAPPSPPAVLTAVSPLEVKRPGKVLVDLRGQGFQEQHAVRVLPVKKAPRGITVVRQKRVNATLITVLLDLSEDVDPGDYALALESGLGERTAAVTFKVTK